MLSTLSAERMESTFTLRCFISIWVFYFWQEAAETQRQSRKLMSFWEGDVFCQLGRSEGGEASVSSVFWRQPRHGTCGTVCERSVTPCINLTASSLGPWQLLLRSDGRRLKKKEKKHIDRFLQIHLGYLNWFKGELAWENPELILGQFVEMNICWAVDEHT